MWQDLLTIEISTLNVLLPSRMNELSFQTFDISYQTINDNLHEKCWKSFNFLCDIMSYLRNDLR
jgi:hypothetical protein